MSVPSEFLAGVREAHSAGKTSSEIEQEALAQGWSKSQVEKAFGKLGLASTPTETFSPDTAGKRSLRSLITALVVVLVLGGIAVGYWQFGGLGQSPEERVIESIFANSLKGEDLGNRESTGELKLEVIRSVPTPSSLIFSIDYVSRHDAPDTENEFNFSVTLPAEFKNFLLFAFGVEPADNKITWSLDTKSISGALEPSGSDRVLYARLRSLPSFVVSMAEEWGETQASAIPTIPEITKEEFIHRVLSLIKGEKWLKVSLAEAVNWLEGSDYYDEIMDNPALVKRIDQIRDLLKDPEQWTEGGRFNKLAEELATKTEPLLKEYSDIIQITNQVKAETADGVPITKYEYKIDQERFIDLVIEISKLQTGSDWSPGFSEEDLQKYREAVQLSLAKLDSLGGEVWLGRSDDRLYHIELNIVTNQFEGTSSVRLFWVHDNRDFGGSFDIQPPTETVPLVDTIFPMLEASLVQSRGSARRASIINSLSSMRAEAELAVVGPDWKYSADLCTNVLADLRDEVDRFAKEPSVCNTSPVQNGGVSAWAAYANTGVGAENSFYCVDSTGYLGPGKAVGSSCVRR